MSGGRLKGNKKRSSDKNSNFEKILRSILWINKQEKTYQI
jgi:hypothetical protein